MPATARALEHRGRSPLLRLDWHRRSVARADVVRGSRAWLAPTVSAGLPCRSWPRLRQPGHQSIADDSVVGFS